MVIKCNQRKTTLKIEEYYYMYYIYIMWISSWSKNYQFWCWHSDCFFQRPSEETYYVSDDLHNHDIWNTWTILLAL